MASLPPPHSHQLLVKRINSSNYLINKQMQHICQLNGMRTQGVKADLQRRIIDALNKAYNEGDSRAYREIEQSIARAKQSQTRGGGGRSTPQPHDSLSPSLPVPPNRPYQPMNSNNMSNGHGYQPLNAPQGYGGGYAMNGQGQPIPQQGPAFRHSPFYSILERLGPVHTCEAMSQHRNSITVQIRAQDHPLISQCITDKSLRVKVFCAAQDSGYQDIAFPHQSELKVNGDDVKANLRGLKNKPGSTRPVDITDLLRLNIRTYANTVEFTYALTVKRFYLVINLCRTVPVERLVQNISTKKISKASVVQELTRNAHDAEIELSSQVLSLKCPLSYMRLVTPVRATTCTHVQCFDADSYLQLQQQGPQWVCPVCSKPAPYDRLAVDEYVRDILANTSQSVEQVDIEPNGQWKAHGPVEDEAELEPQQDAFEVDDDDLVEVGYVGRSNSTAHNVIHPMGVPTPSSGASREGSSMPRPGGTKRSHAEVIDLTLSDDDDEVPQPPQKRPQYNRPSGATY